MENDFRNLDIVSAKSFMKKTILTIWFLVMLCCSVLIMWFLISIKGFTNPQLGISLFMLMFVTLGLLFILPSYYFGIHYWLRKDAKEIWSKSSKFVSAVSLAATSDSRRGGFFLWSIMTNPTEYWSSVWMIYWKERHIAIQQISNVDGKAQPPVSVSSQNGMTVKIRTSEDANKWYKIIFTVVIAIIWVLGCYYISKG